MSVLSATCDEETPQLVSVRTGVPIHSSSDVVVQGQRMGWRATFNLGDDSLRVQRLAPDNRFRGARLEWWKSGKPELAVSVDADCSVRIARRMIFDADGREQAVVHLDTELNDTSTVDLLNPPVPAAAVSEGVRVAMIDAGVNYTLPAVNKRLARDPNGEIQGFDYWDLDRRPFDSNPARSPFFPQRHGTRTASLVLDEAPRAQLVPYRYPRPDMSRMGALLEQITNNNTRIVGIPLGGKRFAEWSAFVESARHMPQTLFIVSAGNEGVDIDLHPVYPANLDLENMIVVTSADDSALPAKGSNWGANAVDLLVPAENRLVTDFDGTRVTVSGSSYAVSRIAAMAARLLDDNPAWSAAQLKGEILDRALSEEFERFVAAGYIPDPLALPTDVTQEPSTSIHVDTHPRKTGYLFMDLNIALLEGSGWQETKIGQLIQGANTIFQQCEIRIRDVRLHTMRTHPRLLDFDTGTAHTLVGLGRVPRPTVYLVRDTLRRPAFEGEAFGRANMGKRTWLKDTVWLTAGIAMPVVGLSHELFHVLSNSGEHTYAGLNLMQATTRKGATKLTTEQCEGARGAGLENSLLSRE